MNQNQNNRGLLRLVDEEFAHNRPGTYSAISKLVKAICKEVNHHKLNYDQLKRVFKEVRDRTGVEVPRKKETLLELPTDEQLRHFFDSIQDPIHKLIFKFLIGTGLRISEACSLEVRRIDFEKNMLFVHQGKGSKDRIAVMSDHLKNELQIYLAGKKNRYLFETIRADKFSPRRIQQMADIYSKKSGVHIYPHLMRHLYATKLCEAGISEDHRKILCGHAKNSDAQQIYTHLTLAPIKEDAIKALNNIKF